MVRINQLHEKLQVNRTFQKVQNSRGGQSSVYLKNREETGVAETEQGGTQMKLERYRWPTLWGPVDHGKIKCNGEALEGFEQEGDI